jgi:hypothetical protein
MQMVNALIEKLISWVDAIFGWFGFYSNKYSQLLVYGLLLFIAAKIFKVKANVNVGKAAK